jgi:hypothetical protein
MRLRGNRSSIVWIVHDDIGIASWMYEPPWKAPLWWWEANFGVGVRSHWAVTNAAAPLFVKGRQGTVFFTSERQPDEPGAQELVLDVRATAVERMAFLYSLHLKPHRVSSVFLYPGFARTDAIERSFREGAEYFEGWSEDWTFATPEDTERRLAETEGRYAHQVYRTEYVTWQLRSSFARRWWRLGEALWRVHGGDDHGAHQGVRARVPPRPGGELDGPLQVALVALGGRRLSHGQPFTRRQRAGLTRESSGRREHAEDREGDERHDEH